MLANFESVRRDLTPYEKDVTPDMTFQLGWPSSAVLLMTLIEELVYAANFDGRYRDAIKSQSEVVDVLQYPSIADRIKDVRDAIAQESVPIPERNATSAGTAGSAPAPTATEGTESGKVAASATTEKPNASGFDSLCEEDQTFWLKAMRKNVNTYIARISDTGSTSELKAKIQGCRMAMTAGDGSGLVLFHFDIKKFGEATTRPDLRIAPLRDSSYVRLVSTVLAARRALSDADGPSSASEPQPLQTLAVGELALLFDGGRRGNASRLINPWKGPGGKKGSTKDNDEDVDEDDNDDEAAARSDIVPNLLQLVFSADSLAARKKIVRGTLSLKQIEWCHIISHSRISLPERAWKHYPGTNCGDTLVGVKLPQTDASSVWKLTWEEKKALYGKRHLIAVGGKTEGASDKNNGAIMSRRTATALEPVCYHPFPEELYASLLTGFLSSLSMT